jgi:hypothetical protein
MEKFSIPRKKVPPRYRFYMSGFFYFMYLWEKVGRRGNNVGDVNIDIRVITGVRRDENMAKPRTKAHVQTELTVEEKRLVRAIAKEREYQSTQEKKIEDIADIVRAVGRSEYIVLDDGVSVTVNDMLVASAYGNALRNPETSFKDLLEAQKVANNDTSDTPQVNITFVSNGQDLGD